MMDNFNEMTGRSIYAKNVRELVLTDVEISGAADGRPEFFGVEKQSVSGLEYV